jgi:penicillin-binding protein-related factor A (putative recombinase)
MTQKWKSVEDAFKSFWNRKDAFCFQFHDARAAMGAAGSKRVFTTSHPSDFIVTDRGEMFYAEVKSSKEQVSFPFSNVKPSQWGAAKRQAAAKGQYFFFLYSVATGNWYRIPSPYLISVKESGRESVKWAELLDFLWTPPQ